jgi:hypothetical protein
MCRPVYNRVCPPSLTVVSSVEEPYLSASEIQMPVKRELRREIRLSAFALDIGELELLWGRMRAVFDAGENIVEEIDFKLPAERLRFDSIDELKAYCDLRGRVSSFTLRMTQGSKGIALKTESIFRSNVATLNVAGPSEVWCAAAIEAVRSIVSRNRLWYWWISRSPLMLICLAIACAPHAYTWLVATDARMNTPVAIAYFGLTITIGFFALTRNKLLPEATVVVTDDLGFVRRYGAELGVGLGIISLVASVLMYLYPGGA